jgi:hypothetical protein
MSLVRSISFKLGNGQGQDQMQCDDKTQSTATTRSYDCTEYRFLNRTWVVLCCGNPHEDAKREDSTHIRNTHMNAPNIKTPHKTTHT